MRLKLGMIAICFGVVTMPLLAQKAKKVKATPKDPQDQIEIVGHVALGGGSVKRFLPTQHYSSYYLYVEHQTGNSVTLLDVTRPTDPLVLASIPLPTTGGSASLFAVAGTSGLITDQAASTRSVSPPETIRVMDFSDLRSPKMAREFTGVTAIQRDERRGLVFVAASDGLWILQEHLATDPEIERAYDYYVRYGSSMYPPPK
jgi:hypothetical protein